MKPRPNRLAMYDDIREVLDAALSSGGGEYELPDHGKAVHWRQRAYMFRKLYAEKVDPRSPYDRLTFRRVPPESSTVIIAMQSQKGIFRPGAGPPLPLTTEAPDIDLLSEAEALLAKIDKGEIL